MTHRCRALHKRPKGVNQHLCAPEIMGSAASVLQAEAVRPLDGSDIESTEQAVAEVQDTRIFGNASVLRTLGYFEDENGYVYYYNASTNDVQWNHPL